MSMEDGTQVERTFGTPQGGVITPPTMLQNYPLTFPQALLASISGRDTARDFWAAGW